MNKLKWKIIFLSLMAAIFLYIDNSMTPMMRADMAVAQLQDSDAAYLGFKGMRYLPLGLSLVFVLTAFFMLRKDIKRFFKGDDQ